MFNYWFCNLADDTYGDGFSVILDAPDHVAFMYLVCERRLAAMYDRASVFPMPF